MSELLTQEENDCLELLADAWNKYLELPLLHPTDRQEFMYAIHAAQNILFSRIYLRSAKLHTHDDKELCLCPKHFGDCEFYDDGKCLSPEL